MIHCDIRPRNFLVDEYGILKLSDFKFARKIPKEALSDTPLPSRGTITYMSPELFTPEGVHSFQSDFWAIGCVLYQLRRGSLPFGESTQVRGLAC
jgi:serine/threonine-protein kinase ULK4